MTSSSRSAGSGGLLAGAGALILLGSLWLPWYTMRFPDALRDAFKGIGANGATQPTPQGGPGEALGQAFSGLFSGLAAAIPDEISAKGWQALDGADVALAVIAIVALLIAMALSGAAGGVRVDAASAGRIVAALGAVALAIVAYNAVSPPGGDAPAIFGEDLMQLRYGLAVAGGGALLMIAGGLMSGRARELPEPSVTPLAYSPGPEQPLAAGTVAPPGWAPPGV